MAQDMQLSVCREELNTMDRWTERFNSDGAKAIAIHDGSDFPDVYFEGEKEYDAMNAFADYEDLEEQGLLMRLPCKVGDTVWELCLCDDGNYKIFPMVVKTISKYGALRQVKKDITIWNIYAESDYTYMYKSFADFGKTVFSTKEEAEKKLEEF